jgi:hypothetical protein
MTKVTACMYTSCVCCGCIAVHSSHHSPLPLLTDPLCNPLPLFIPVPMSAPLSPLSSLSPFDSHSSYFLFSTFSLLSSLPLLSLDERDAMKELRSEISSVIKTIAQEYVEQFPSPVIVPAPSSSKKTSSAGAVGVMLS